MMNKSMNKSVSGRNKRPSTYKSRNGVYKTPAGTFVARKCVDGVKVSRTFKRKKDAKSYLKNYTNSVN